MSSIKHLLLFLYLICSNAISFANTPSPSQEHTPCVVVIFGATGDLTARKLLPAFYNLAHEERLSPNTAIVGFARGQNTDESFQQKMGEAIDQFSRTKPKDNAFWSQWKNNIFYNRSDFDNDQGYDNLQELMTKLDQEFGTQGNRLYYLATAPSYFATVIKKLNEHHLISQPGVDQGWTRVIIEKPFGNNLESAINLHDEISQYLDDSQIYLMDHYLGKEGVQNILSLRSELYEILWNHKYIDNVQITLAEDIGIGNRAAFWEETGALRDLFQNHVLQILALLTMEIPETLNAANIHSEKIKALNAIRPFSSDDIVHNIVRGQYAPGEIKGQPVLGYIQEKNVPQNSSADTFIAAKLFIDNQRWEGVPFYLRAGKRLPKQTTEIAINFKGNYQTLFMRVQPNMHAQLVPYPDLFENAFKYILKNYYDENKANKFSPEAYERLLYDCIQGDQSLFVDSEEQLAAWRLLTPVLEYWKEHPETVQIYEAGTWGANTLDVEWKLCP